MTSSVTPLATSGDRTGPRLTADISLTGGQGDHLGLVIRAGEIITDRL